MISFKKYRVQDREDKYDETLTCIDRDSLSNSEEMNKTNQVDFTATNDNSIGYQLLQNENYIVFDGQKYRIKQAEKDDEGYDNKRTVSATHIGLIANIFISTTKSMALRNFQPTI